MFMNQHQNYINDNSSKPVSALFWFKHWDIILSYITELHADIRTQSKTSAAVRLFETTQIYLITTDAAV